MTLQKTDKNLKMIQGQNEEKCTTSVRGK